MTNYAYQRVVSLYEGTGIQHPDQNWKAPVAIGAKRYSASRIVGPRRISLKSCGGKEPISNYTIDP